MYQKGGERERGQWESANERERGKDMSKEWMGWGKKNEERKETEQETRTERGKREEEKRECFSIQRVFNSKYVSEFLGSLTSASTSHRFRIRPNNTVFVCLCMEITET